MIQRSFIDAQFATASDLQPRTWLHYATEQVSFVARINAEGGWTAYQGFPTWSPVKISVSGYRLSEAKAREIFPVCAHLAYCTDLKLIPFKFRQRPSIRAVLNSFEESLIEAGFAEIEDLKIHRLKAGLAVAEALEIANKLKTGSITNLSSNVNLLCEQLEDAMQALRPSEEKTPSEKTRRAS